MPYSTDTFGKELYNAAQSASLAACTSPSLILVCCVHTGCAKTVLHVAKKKRDNNCMCVCDLALEHLGGQQLFVRPLFQF